MNKLFELKFGSQANSSLRDKPDQEWIDQFVFDLYVQEVRNV